MGLVDNQEIRIDAVRLVWEVEGVKEVAMKLIGNRDTKRIMHKIYGLYQARKLQQNDWPEINVYNFETINGKVY